MQVSFEELKTLYRSIYVDVDVLVTDTHDVSEDDMERSEENYKRLELIAKFATELCKYRPKPFIKD